MNIQEVLNLKAPILYVNPPLNADPALVEEVSRSGGLGIVDHATGGPAGFSISKDVPHGVRIRLEEAKTWDGNNIAVLIVLPLEDAELLSSLPEGAFRNHPVPVIAEVGNGDQAMDAERAGVSGLIARGYEGPGWVSETCSFVLLQEILDVVQLPVFVQGGIGLETAAGAMAAGAAGIVLDVHLLLAAESAVPTTAQEFLKGLSLPATVALAEDCGSPLRVYSRVGTRMVRELRKIEESLTDEEIPAYRERLRAVMKMPVSLPDSDEALLPLSESVIVGRRLVEQFKTASGVMAEFTRKLTAPRAQWPFAENSALCRRHNTRYPLVQGPMAHVSDNPNFLAAVAEAGALPVLAMGNMPPPIAREGVAAAREKTGGKFGVGLIGLEVNRAVYEAHLEIMKENPPPFAILAAGSVELAQRIERIGTVCYLHCPTPGMVGEALKAGVRNFVFEGCESGGHVGLLGSLDLWTANLAEIEKAAADGIPLNEISVLLAGGIASARSAAFVAGMMGDLAAAGLRVGMQMGTAYLTCDESVSTCAVTSTYRNLTLKSKKTVIIGRTVNIRARSAGSPAAANLIEREHERLRKGMPLRDRKEEFEIDNLGGLRLAAKGCAIDPQTAGTDCPTFCDLPEDDQLDRGVYLMGQAVSLLNKPLNFISLHDQIVEGGKEIFESRPAVIEEERIMEAHPEEDHSITHLELPKEPIAIIGIGLHFPGADSADSFWEQIVTGRSGIVDVPEGRWENPDFFYDPDPKTPDRTYSRIGGFLTNFVFNPLVYRIPPSVAKKMDRTQQMAVSCVGQALQDANLPPEQLKGKKVGIILGNSMGGGESTDRYAERLAMPRTLSVLETSLEGIGLAAEARTSLLAGFQSRYLENLPEITEDSLPGELANVISGRVANVFNLEGPNFTVDAACASSMAAALNAVAALREGKIDYAITGGVDAAMHPSSFIKFCKVGALSPDGSRPFDEGANGFVMGEGVGVMILKRLSDAVRDGDKIYATILDIGSSSDGRGKGITAPNAAGQERAVRACLEGAGIDPASIGLIEAHGTSTPVGDKTELTVLDRLLREAGAPTGSVGIGSVKSQIGHLKAAAGAAGMIKAVLSLYHRTFPPTINVQRPNSCIDWQSSPLRLLTKADSWNTSNGDIRRAGVSAFGFGGTNFHVIFQEHVPGLRLVHAKKEVSAPAPVTFSPPNWPKPSQMETACEAWIIGGNNPEEINRKIQRLLGQLNPARAAALASQYRKEAAESTIRIGFAASDGETAAKKLEFIRQALSDPSKAAAFPTRGIHASQGSLKRADAGVAFLFPGQGSQYPFMLRDLAEHFPIVAQTLQEADDVLTSLGLRAVTSGMFPYTNGDATTVEHDTDPMKDTQFLQPMILAADTAIFRLLTSMGVQPVAAAGHSLGEYAACVAAGVFSFRDALEAVAVRGREMARVSIADPGLMMSIPADARLVEEVLAEVDGYVVAANKNSPKQTVISGETLAVKKAGELFRARGIEGMLLPVSAAFHSGVVAPAREPFMKTLERLTLKPPLVPVLSNVTGDFYPVGPAAPSNIRDLLGKQFAAPVEWVKSLRRLYGEGIRLFVECGPKRVLTNLALDTLPADEILALPSNHPKKGGITQLMETLVALAVEGAPIEFDKGREAVDQPTEHKPQLKVVTKEREVVREVLVPGPSAPHPLDNLMDEELRGIAAQRDFRAYLEMQSEPIRALLKTGYQAYMTKVLPMEQTVRQVKAEGMDFKPVVVSGLSTGLPTDVRFPFDRETLDDLILGRNFIKRVPKLTRFEMLDKNIERLVKGPAGEAELREVDDDSGVLHLAGFFSQENIIDEYGLDERIVRSMDVTTRLAMAAGIEALRDAGIPLIQFTRTTTTGKELPDGWALPPALRDETGIIFASAFPGMASMVDEVTREAAARYGAGAKKRLIEFYTGLVQRISDDQERDRITTWFAKEFGLLNPAEAEELYTFNRDFLLKVMTMAQGQLAQYLKAYGPNTHVDAACASTTQAVVMARDWVRSGRAKRVLVVAADDAAGSTLFPWIGSGFLAMGAATTSSNVNEAALPFDERRHGLILGSAAAGIVVEQEDLVRSRGVEPIASIEAGMFANSGYHPTRLNLEHISSIMGNMISKWEEQTGVSRDELAENVFFMSHETYSPKRGGSAAAEIRALRDTFGDKAKLIPIANTKGLTGHAMGAGVEDAVAIRCLQKQMLPPIPNLKHPDPEFADLNLSRGGACRAEYALRLAAGFGSQVVMALYKSISKEENRLVDLAAHRAWLKQITGYTEPVITVDHRTLHVSEKAPCPGVRPAEFAGAAVPASAPQPIAAPVVVSHKVEPVATAIEPKIATPVAKAAEVREKILALLTEKTGYPADMLDTNLDLEADLGIDTVKQAEFISEVRDHFNIPRIEGLKIAEFPTIEHIINFVLEHVGGSVSVPAESPAAAVFTGRSSVGGTEVREKILSLLSEKTGYPSDMLDTNLDLEADLGIDTVKQAEFISEVRDYFNIPRIEGLKIAEFPTIEHIINFVLGHVGGSAPAPIESLTTSVVAAGSSAGEAEVREKILTLLSEKTGYPSDMLDLDLDLEADLGIDTVKQAEFISDVRDHFNIPRIEGLKIAEFPTITHIINFVLEHVGRSVSAPAGIPALVSVPAESPKSTAAVTEERVPAGEAEVKEKILTLLSEKTGYPADMLDLDLDLEADLGIDTVKQAEFISEVRDHFQIPRVEGLKISDFPTITHIIGFVMENRNEPIQKAETPPAPVEPQAETVVTDRQEVNLFETRLVLFETPDAVTPPQADEVLVIGGPLETAEEILTRLQELGYASVRCTAQPSISEDMQDKKVGIVNLLPIGPGATLLTPTLELYVSCAKLWDQGPAFMVTGVSEDGAFGFENPAADAHIIGSLTGASKAFGREYPETHTRVLDLHPDLSPTQVADIVKLSLTQAFPLETAVGKAGELKAVRAVPVLEDGLEPGLNDGDVVLVTGGARGITAECVRFLAEQTQLTIVLLGRTALSKRAEQLQHFDARQWNEEKMRIVERFKRDGKAPTPVMVEKELGRLKGEAEVSQTIRELRSLGSEVLYRAVDIRNDEALDQAIQEVAEICKRVDLVIHAAGIDASRALRSKTVEQMENLISVKVQGMLNLRHALEKHEMLPRRVIGFGSVSGRFGNMAQVDYSAANDGLAHLLRKLNKEWDAKASIIDWAPWAEIGMAVRGSVQQSLEAAGIDFIPPKRGAELLAQEITRSSRSAEVLAAGRVGPLGSDAFDAPGSKKGERTFFSGQPAEITVFIPGEYMRAKVALNPLHPVLDDHRINRAAVFPGVGGMEVMRAAATTLNPDAAYADFQNVLFKGPIKAFKDDPFHIEVEAIRVEDGSQEEVKYFCRISSWFLDKAGRKVGTPRLHHEGYIVVCSKGEAPMVDFPVWQDWVWVSEHDIYNVFFHGPAFRLFAHVKADAAGTGIEFRYQDTPQRPDMFSDPIPAAIEAVFQGGAAAGLEAAGIMCLPVSVDRARVYQTDAIPYDGRVIRRGTGTQGFGPEGREGFRYDAMVRDEQGRAVVILEGVEMMEAQPMDPFPGRIFQSMVPKDDVLQQLEQSPETVLKTYLADDEIQEHSEKKTPKRAEDWFVGRVAAKRCVQRVLSESDEAAPTPQRIRIVKNDLGKPIAELVDRPGFKVSDVSLSHSNGMAVAVAVAPETFQGLGIDVEKIEPRNSTWEQDYFTDEERLFADAGDDEQRIHTLTAMWSLKEAFVKALGTGLRFDLKDIRVTNMDDHGRAVLELHNEAKTYLHNMGGGSIEARVEGQENMVIAKVLIRKM